MKTLIIGFLVFFTWGAVSTKYYVCKIKNLCNEKELLQTNTAAINTSPPPDSINNLAVNGQLLNPGTMTINFEFDKSDFTPDNTTDSFFEKSRIYMNQDSTSQLIIIGHTDAVGSDLYNQELGFRRAKSLQDYFERKGVSRDKIILESKGERDPSDDNNTISGRANNRRTVVTLNK